MSTITLVSALRLVLCASDVRRWGRYDHIRALSSRVVLALVKPADGHNATLRPVQLAVTALADGYDMHKVIRLGPPRPRNRLSLT